MELKFEEFVKNINIYLSSEFEITGDILPEMTITEALDLDSLDLLDLVVSVEKQYGVKVKGEDFHEIKSMSDFHSHVYKQLQPVA
jgi:acyl carrier protein